MEDLNEFMPTSKEVLVGTDKMVVKTFSIAKRDAVAKVLLSNLDIAKLVRPIMDNIRQTREASARVVSAIKNNNMEAAEKIRDQAAKSSIDIGEIVTQVKEIAQSLLTEDMTLVSCVILDVLENRQRIKTNGDLTRNEKYQFEFSEPMFGHVRDNLTPVQEFQVLKAAVQVNDLSKLVKNYWTLVASNLTAETTGDEETQTTE